MWLITTKSIHHSSDAMTTSKSNDMLCLRYTPELLWRGKIGVEFLLTSPSLIAFANYGGWLNKLEAVASPS